MGNNAGAFTRAFASDIFASNGASSGFWALSERDDNAWEDDKFYDDDDDDDDNDDDDFWIATDSSSFGEGDRGGDYDFLELLAC